MPKSVADAAALPAATDVEALPVSVAGPFRRLLAALEAAGLRYCHWKSNLRLLDSLTGEDDLDLLVHRADATAVCALLAKAGFKLARSGGGLDHPGVIHALALDDPDQRILHAHLYFQVLTGDSLVKSYHLPLEKTLLDGEARLHGVRVPEPEVELAVFLLRILLKHRALSEVMLVNRDNVGVADELAWLLQRADWAATRATLVQWMPDADPALFDAMQEAVAVPGAIWRRITLAHRIVPHLRNLRRIAPGAEVWSRGKRLRVLVLEKFRRHKDMQLVTGGILVAMVGPKAVGKSTLGGMLAATFGEHLDLRRVHVGKPPATWLTLAPGLMIPLARKLLPGQRSGAYERTDVDRSAPKRYSLIHVLRMTMLAYDRRALLRRCWRDAASGRIVMTDRYPSLTVGAMDSCRFSEDDITNSNSMLARWLMRQERALCRNLPQPDLILRLEADIGTTLQRDALRIKPGGPDAEAVLRRWTRETTGDFGNAPVVQIDTKCAREVSAAAAVRAVWDAL